MIKRRDFLTMTGAGLTALAMPAGGAETIRWKMVTSWPKNTPGVGVNAARLAELIGRLSGGRLTVQLFAAGELVPPFEVIDAVQKGTAEIGHSALYYGVGKAKALHFFTTVPFGLGMNELAAWLLFGGGQALKDEALEPFGLRAFYAGNSGVQAMGWFRKEIASIADVKGLKMRIAGLGGAAMQKLGAVTVMMPPGEIFSAMQSGTVDAAEWVGPWNDIAFGLYKVAKYYYLPAFHEPGPALDALVNRQAYEALPADLQAIVEAACRAVALETDSDFLFHNVQALDALAGHGVEVRTLPDDVVDALGKATMEVLEELMAEDALARKVGESYLGFARAADRYAARMDLAMLAQRHRVWAQAG